MRRATVSLVIFSLLACLPAGAQVGFESVEYLGEIRDRLEQPVDIAVSPTGGLYILDAKTGQVLVYNREGSLRSRFGGKQELPKPVALAAGPNGRTAVADSRLQAVVLFDEQGKRIGAFGDKGSARGQFHGLSDVAIDRFGLIHTVDSKNRSVARFSPGGILLFERRFENSAPASLALDPAGHIYVLMNDGKTLYRIDPDSESQAIAPLKLQGKSGSATGVFVDPRGNLYLSRSDKNNIQKFDSRGALLTAFGSRGKGPGAFRKPTRLDGAEDGSVFVVDNGNRRVQIFRLEDGDRPPMEVDTHSPPIAELGAVENIEEPISDLLQRGQDQLRLFGKSGRVLLKGISTSISGSPGRKEGQLYRANGAALLPDGRIVVADSGNHRLQIFSSGRHVATIGERGDEPGTFRNPDDVAVNSQGMIYVADTGNARIQIFTGQGIYLHSFGQPDKSRGKGAAPPGALSKPTALAIDSQDRVYVLDAGLQRISRFDGRGQPLGTVGGVREPTDISIDPDDNLYIADAGCHCIKVYDSAGRVVMRFGSNARGPGRLGDITAIAAGESSITVADAAEGQLKRFDLNLDGLTLEVRVRASHSFFVPEGTPTDSDRFDHYRKIASDAAARKLALQAGAPYDYVRENMRIDRETHLSGGEVMLVVSVPRGAAETPGENAAAEPAAEHPEADKQDKLELAF